MTTELSVTLPGGPFAAAAARRALGGLAWTLDPRVLADIQLLVTELVTNAVRHAGAGQGDEVSLTVARHADAIRVTVGDHGPGFMPRSRRRDPREPGGWGLVLVDEMAREWGVESGYHRSAVWFELPAGAPSLAAAS